MLIGGPPHRRFCTVVSAGWCYLFVFTIRLGLCMRIATRHAERDGTKQKSSDSDFGSLLANSSAPDVAARIRKGSGCREAAGKPNISRSEDVRVHSSGAPRDCWNVKTVDDLVTFDMCSGERLGAGATGVVYKGWRRTEAQKEQHVWPVEPTLAVKVGATSNEAEDLKREFKVLTRIQDVGIPRPILLDSLKHGKVTHTYMAVQRLGESLYDILVKNEWKLTKKCLIFIARQALARLEQIEEKDYVHHDMKPQNFMTGGFQKAGGYMNDIYVADDTRVRGLMLQHAAGHQEYEGLPVFERPPATYEHSLGPDLDELHQDTPSQVKGQGGEPVYILWGMAVRGRPISKYWLEIDIENVPSKKGYVQRKLKIAERSYPVMTLQANMIYLIDFGFSHRLGSGFKGTFDVGGFSLGLTPRYMIDKQRVGTMLYFSTRIHKGMKHSYRDDLESLSYVLFEMLRTRYFIEMQGTKDRRNDWSLPWKRFDNETSMLISKKSTAPGNLNLYLDYIFDISPVPDVQPSSELVALLTHAKSLVWGAKPDWEYLNKLFEDRMAKEWGDEDPHLDWVNPPNIVEPTVPPQDPCAVGDPVMAVWPRDHLQYSGIIAKIENGEIFVDWYDDAMSYREVRAEQVFKNGEACSTLAEEHVRRVQKTSTTSTTTRIRIPSKKQGAKDTASGQSTSGRSKFAQEMENGMKSLFSPQFHFGVPKMFQDTQKSI